MTLGLLLTKESTAWAAAAFDTSTPALPGDAGEACTAAAVPAVTSATVNAPWVDNSNKWAGGGYLSNTEDLALFGDAMITGKVVKPATLDLLWTSQRTADGKPTGYGIGWVVATDSAGRQIVRHSGGSDGGTALLVLYPKQRMVFAFLFNSDGPQPPLQRVIDLFVGKR